MASEPGSSEQVVLEIDFDNNTVIVYPQSGGVYQYSLDDPGIVGMIERLEGSGAQYTVYSQTESYTESEYERMRREFYGY